MVRFVALFLLLSFVSVVLCGFVVNQQLTQHTAHSAASSVEHHFSMWEDFSTAPVSDIVAYVTMLILVVASVLLLVCTPFLSLYAYAVIRSFDPIPIRKKERVRVSPEIRRWLSRFELSPSFL